MKKLLALLLGSALLLASLGGCGATVETTAAQTETYATAEAGTPAQTASPVQATAYSTAETASAVLLSAEEEFSNRDMTQTADLSEAEALVLESGGEVTVSSAGVYVLTGSAENCTVIVEAGDEDKVQLVLDGVSITNGDYPCIYVKNADKTFITTAEGSVNTLTVTGSFRADGDTNTDAAVFAKDDLVLNGLGTLNVSSTENGISCKDDLKVTGGTLNITCEDCALEAHDSIRIAGGSITAEAGNDGLHAEDDEDDTVGYVYISGGSLDIRVGDDGIHATTILQIDGGELDIIAAEGLEGTYVQLNGGEIRISASDDGINGAAKSGSYPVTVAINGGSVTVTMGAGDTDAIDSNGSLLITGGTLNITAQSPFDYDGAGELTGGTVIVNGQEVTALTNQFGGMGGGFGGMPGTAPGEMPESGFGGMPGGAPGQMPGGGSGGAPGGAPGQMPGGGFGGQGSRH